MSGSGTKSTNVGTRFVPLDDADRTRALIGGVPMRARPAVVPYDRAAMRARVLRVLAQGWWRAPWDAERFTIAIDEEEARVYYAAILSGAESLAMVDALLAAPPGVPNNGRPHECDYTCLPVLSYRAFGLEELVRLLFRDNRDEGYWLVGFERDVLPFLDATDRARCVALIRASLGKRFSELGAARALVALGEPPSTARPIVHALTQGSARPTAIGGEYGPLVNVALHAVVALGDPDEIAREAKRLDALPCAATDVRMLLAATGARCLDLVAQAVGLCSTKAEAEALVRATGAIESPACAQIMLALATRSKAEGVARTWLETYPALAFTGLLPEVMRGGPTAAAALDVLVSLAKHGAEDAMERALRDFPDEVAAALRARIAPPAVETVPVATHDALPDWATFVLVGRTSPTTEMELTPAQRDVQDRCVQPLDDRDAGDVFAVTVPEPEPRPAARPFDLVAAVDEVFANPHRARWGYDTLAMSREEAAFWILEHRGRYGGLSTETFIERVRHEEVDGNALPGQLAAPAFLLYGFEGIANAFARASEYSVQTCVNAVVRYLTLAEREALLRVLLDREVLSFAIFELACLLGAKAEQIPEMLRRLEPLESDGFESDRLLACLYRLDDVDAIVAEATRKKVYPRYAGARWLSKTGLAGIGILAGAAKVMKSPELLNLVATTVSKDTARALLGAFGHAKLRPVIVAWIDAHPLVAIEAFVPLVGTKDKLAADAVKQLRRLCARGLTRHVERIARGNAKVETAVLDPGAGRAKVSDADRRITADLPAITLDTPAGTRRLGADVLAQIVAELRASELGEPTEAIERLRELCPETIRDRIATAMFKSWVDDSMPPKDRWKLDAIGLIGGDESVAALLPFIHLWPTTNQHQRALRAIDCLRAMGTDGALREVHALAERVKRASLREYARAAVDLIAQDRGLTRDELGDRIVPDAGLDARGGCVLDFGSRTFTVSVRKDLVPIVRDAAGKKIAAPPKPTASDDAARAGDALATWKRLKKTLAEVKKTQSARLELAMIAGRRFAYADFDALFIRHPLMSRLGQCLVWSTFDAAGEPENTFRIVDDGTFADENDAPLRLQPEGARIGLVHTMHFNDASRASWATIFADYDLVPPFVQLTRPVHRLLPDETSLTSLTRWSAHDVDPKSLFFGLESRDWFRGAVGDGGVISRHTKEYGGVTAVVEYSPGGYGGNGAAWERQSIRSLELITSNAESAKALSAIDPLILSEAIQDVTFVYEQGAPK